MERSFYFLLLGAVLNLSAYVGITNLQSSLNYTKSLGTTSLGVLYSTSILICLFITNFALVRLGGKLCLMIGEASFAVFTIANFYPRMYTLISASVVASLGEAFIWSASSLYITRLVAEAWLNSNCDDYSEDHLRNKYFGTFFALLKLCQVFGNVISYAVLYGGRMLRITDTRNTNITNISNCGVLESHNEILDYSKYHPSSMVAVYILLAVYLTMQVASVMIHGAFLFPFYQQGSGSANILTLVKSSLWETFHHITSLYQLLLTPIMIYFGLILAFAFNDFTKVFVSCTLGIEKVGLLMGIYGVGNAAAAYVIGWLNSKAGLLCGFVISAIFGTCIWIGLLTWIPTESSTHWLFVLALMLGCGDGVWQTVTVSSVPIFFAKTEEVAFSVQSLYTVCGMAVGFSWSKFLFVRTKIIVLFTIMCLGSVLWGVAECIRRKRTRKHKESERNYILESSIRH